MRYCNNRSLTEFDEADRVDSRGESGLVCTRYVGVCGSRGLSQLTGMPLYSMDAPQSLSNVFPAHKDESYNELRGPQLQKGKCGELEENRKKYRGKSTLCSLTNNIPKKEVNSQSAGEDSSKNSNPIPREGEPTRTEADLRPVFVGEEWRNSLITSRCSRRPLHQFVPLALNIMASTLQLAHCLQDFKRHLLIVHFALLLFSNRI